MCEQSFVPTITISYSFTGLSNGAWLVSNTHSSRLINISSLKKRATLRWSSRCVQELEQEHKDMDEDGEEIPRSKDKRQFWFKRPTRTLTVFRYLSIKNLIRTWMTWHDANLSILWSFIFTRTKDSLVHWATEWDG